MAPSLDFTVTLLPIAPFIAAIFAPWVKRFSGPFAGVILALIPASIFVYLLFFVDLIAHGGYLVTSIDWVPAYGDLKLSFYIDGLSLTFGLLISGIGTIIIAYTGSYLAGHPQQGRFFSFMLMFMGSMLGLVLADNMIVLFVFWELTSITSFLLIGFDHTRQASRRAAIQALVITGGGGLLLLAGIGLLHLLTQADGGMGTWSFTQMLSSPDFVRDSALYTPIMLLFLGGAFTKSAQFPFQFWLPNAMEAPTPVSAFLHSATMVKAGVYLCARMTPLLGDTPLWSGMLMTFGGITLLWGATLALRQTDLKQILAQTTVASLGLLMLLLGIGTEVAISAAVLYLAAHAFYKAALFLVAGLVDHETGTREITELGGLWKPMPATFIAAFLAVFSMAGLPPAIGYFGKEEMYAALNMGEWQSVIAVIVMIAGNALMIAAGLAVLVLPFLGKLKHTPKHAHEGPITMYLGPILLGVIAVLSGILTHQLGEYYLVPTASTIYNHQVHSHLSLMPHFDEIAIYLSLITWALGAFLYYKLTDIRLALKRFAESTNWTFDKAFDACMFGLIKGADAITRRLHHGRLEVYLLVVFTAFAVALFAPLLMSDGQPFLIDAPHLTIYEWAIIAIAVIGLVAVLTAHTRLLAIVSLGIQGFAVALIFMLFGAPDLSFTQFMVEILSVVILALVMTRLHLLKRDARVLEEALRDGVIALLCGVGITTLLISVLQYPLNKTLTDFFAETSVPIAHGHNVVNVILVDYRGIDTLGEISVVMAAGLAIIALIKVRTGGAKTGVGAKRQPSEKRVKGGEV